VRNPLPDDAGHGAPRRIPFLDVQGAGELEGLTALWFFNDLAEIRGRGATNMGFREHLQQVVRNVDGAVACSLMGTDGIEVDTHVVDGAELDLKSLLIEYSGVFRSAREASEAHEAGGVAELSIQTEKLLTVARLVSPEYFMVVALRPDGNFGKARFMLRVTAPKLVAEL
jgi:predicted regulator of Ras-like GTPase activity (Roadblock/LC7/MglB family)